MKAVIMVILCQLLLPVISLDVDGIHIVLPNKQPAPDISLKWFRPKAASAASPKPKAGAEKSTTCLCDQNKTQELENQMIQLQDVVRRLTDNKTEGQGNESLSRVTDNRNSLLFEIMQDQLKNFTKELKKLGLAVNGLQDARWGSDGFTASNGLSYKIISTLQNFEDSQAACRRLGGHLAHIGIRNDTIHREILQHFGNRLTIVYIDLNDIDTEGEFRWGDGVLASDGWTYWYRLQPDNYNEEDCAEIDLSSRGGHWNDVNCDNRLTQALCERRVIG